LDAAGIDAVLDGGWGIDALLGEQTRPHSDLDLAVAREQRTGCWLRGDLGRAQTALARLGFHPLVFDGEGNGWQELGEGRWGLYPAEGLAGEGVVGDRRVRCLTAQLQHRFLLGLSSNADDVRDLRLLAGRFDLPLPPGLG
jgi:lincosamide nucleotidyltransferase A/C/D/E